MREFFDMRLVEIDNFMLVDDFAWLSKKTEMSKVVNTIFNELRSQLAAETSKTV